MLPLSPHRSAISRYARVCDSCNKHWLFIIPKPVFITAGTRAIFGYAEDLWGFPTGVFSAYGIWRDTCCSILWHVACDSFDVIASSVNNELACDSMTSSSVLSYVSSSMTSWCDRPCCQLQAWPVLWQHQVLGNQDIRWQTVALLS